MISQLNNQLLNVEKYALMSKINRLLVNPLKYIYSILYSKVFYKYFDSNVKLNTKTFWNDEITINFPSAIDIYLSGGKTHNSEIRLAKYLINNLKDQSTFLDIGAHFGYFSLLASQIIHHGKVISIEPSSNTFEILKLNTEKNKEIEIFNMALCNQNEVLEFYEFPTIYSEYNTINKDQYIHEDWFDIDKTQVTKINCVSGDSFLTEHQFKPNFIKMDVEGSEDQVVLGLKNYLTQNSPIVIMEFCITARGNSNHILADNELKKMNYIAHKIDNQGELKAIEGETKNYVDSLALESDNIVYSKY